jgi:hypothetical protein
MSHSLLIMSEVYPLDHAVPNDRPGGATAWGESSKSRQRRQLKADTGVIRTEPQADSLDDRTVLGKLFIRNVGENYPGHRCLSQLDMPVGSIAARGPLPENRLGSCTYTTVSSRPSGFEAGSGHHFRGHQAGKKLGHATNPC